MTNEKLAQHLSNKLWISKDIIVEVLGEYVETKHPIELVNEKYPNGWCTDKCKEVSEDLNSFFDANYSDLDMFYGVKNKDDWSNDNIWETYITHSEYMAITRGSETPQPTKRNLDIDEPKKERDWTGVKFHHNNSGILTFERHKLSKEDYWCEGNKSQYTQQYIDKQFSNGSWIELTEEKIVHTQLPNTLEQRVKRIEERLNIIYHT